MRKLTLEGHRVCTHAWRSLLFCWIISPFSRNTSVCLCFSITLQSSYHLWGFKRKALWKTVGCGRGWAVVERGRVEVEEGFSKWNIHLFRFACKSHQFAIFFISLWSNLNEPCFSHYSANACLTPVCAVFGKAVTTVEGIGSTTMLHPVQERLSRWIRQ